MIRSHVPAYTLAELDIIRRCDTPEKIQHFLDTEIRYGVDPVADYRLRCLRGVLRDRMAHCFEGALTAAAMLEFHGHPPLILCIEARDIDHMVALFRRDQHWGAVAHSRDPLLKWRDAQYAEPRDIVMSYYPLYYNEFTKDHSDLTIRGYAVVDFSQVEGDWRTSEEDVLFVEEMLYRVPYTALFPEPGKERFLSLLDGSIEWLPAARGA
jgi:hypothetical protein